MNVHSKSRKLSENENFWVGAIQSATGNLFSIKKGGRISRRLFQIMTFPLRSRSRTLRYLTRQPKAAPHSHSVFLLSAAEHLHNGSRNFRTAGAAAVGRRFTL